MSVKRSPFGTLSTGDEISLYTLNAGDFSASWNEYGATWTSFLMPDFRGFKDDILLGFPTLDGYARGPNPYFGATIGRYANRIGGSRFILGDKKYALYANNGLNHLHGGRRGFDKRLWKTEASTLDGDPALRFSRRSLDGEEGYPGSIDVAVTVTLSASGRLSLDYEALPEADTPLNLTNHAYFNLGGEGSGLILGHRVRLDCGSYLEVNKDLIPLAGLPMKVEGTAFDFQREKAIGADIEAAGGGYDHCFVISGSVAGVRTFAEVREPGSCRSMKVSTDLPAVQFYTGNSIPDVQGKGCSRYVRHS
ncbi:MAG: galactose mutarotase [Spirochaetes bacterium]|nr:galactose mutarotase [Spirochaetota bacterium]